MPVFRDELTEYLNTYLQINEFKDYGPNGLQVEGKKEIHKIITGVSASVALFEKAIEHKANAILVHHGIIWNFERPLYKGGYRERVKLLLEHDINLYGYHLPLDAHEEVGNNAILARILELQNIQPFGEHDGQKIGMTGDAQNKSSNDFFDLIKEKINPDALIFPFGPLNINNVGIISGAAQKDVKQAVLQNLDLYLTGEVSEHTLHYVKEEKIHFVAAGHHATERFGIQALGEHVKSKFDVQVEYIEIPNPV
jgi:dinuclear metal center YbgI/SA1388 family protein